MPTATQIANTTAAAFDVQYRYFSGPPWASFIKTGLAVIAGWTAPDTNKPGGWTEITDRTSFASRFMQERRGASVTWTADLSGWNYSAALLDVGVTILCWRRIWRPDAGWQAWEREFIGEVANREDANDYRNGREWSRQIVGYDGYLSRFNAPRITAGKIRVTEGASVTGSEALALPEQEADKGEFVGGTANVSPDNVVDGNKNTVYISNAIPTQTVKPWPNTLWDGRVCASEVFFRPLPGWTTARTWWVEVFNQRGQNERANADMWIGRYSGGMHTVWNVHAADIEKGHCSLFVANRAAFDEYTGAENNGAQVIVDVSQFHDGQVELTADGMVYCGFAFAWAPGGAYRRYVDPASGTVLFEGYTFDSNSVPTGQSLINNFNGEHMGPGAGNGTWSINPNPHPGANSAGDGPVWVKVTLPDNVCLTLDQISAASTTIRLDNYRAWLTPTSGYARGVVNGCVFRWTSRDANGLQGVTWESAPAAAIPQGTRAYPYVNGSAQTGYPLTATHLVRRKLPTVKHYKVYWSAYDARGYTDTGWASDYYAHFHEQQGNTQNLRLTDPTTDGTNGVLWVRTILYLIYAMTDGGRVKLNEIGADLAQAALDLGGTPALDGTNSVMLAYWLWYAWAGLATGDFWDESGGGHTMGQHALAITPVARVYDDLAAATGCLAWFSPTGGLRWLADPWWPKNTAPTVLAYTFDAASVRDKIELSVNPAHVEYVILNALSLEGDPHAQRYVYPQPLIGQEPPVWALVQEISDRVIARDGDAPAVAQMELEKINAEARSCRLTVKGVGEWCRPGLWVKTYYDTDGDGNPDTLSWLIEKVVTERRVDDRGVREVATSLILRGFRG